MTISTRATAVRFDDYMMWVDLEDGRNLGVPLAGRGDMAHSRKRAA